jgi:dTDP-4-amino-4,6-dideoxygalactose transaminase
VQRYYRELNDLPFLYLPKIPASAECAWWPLPVFYQGDSPSRDDIVAALLAEGLEVGKGLSPNKGNLHTQVIKNKKYYPYSDHVPHFLKNVDYDEWSCPAADEILRTIIRLPVDNRYTDQDITETIAGIRKVWSFYFAEDMVS